MNAGEPTKEQLMAMAYADGELDEAGRSEFESLMASRADLAREVSQLKRLQILARQMAGPEPIDLEWARLEDDALHRAGFGLGFALLLAASLGLIGWGGYGLVTSEMGLLPKLLCGGLMLGGGVLFAATLRARLRTLPYDPYTEVQR